jgi:hypothetical protein
MWPRRESANDELLTEIHAVLDSGSATLARFADTILSFPNDSFQSLLSHRRQHLLSRRFDMFGNRDPLGQSVRVVVNVTLSRSG